MTTVTRKKGSSRAKRRAELRDKLLDATEAAVGAGERLTQLQLGALCAAAGVARSTFYLHFADRGELHAAWLDDIATRLESVGAAWWRLDGEAGRADLREALSSLVQAYRPHAALMRELYAASASDPELREQVDLVTARNIKGLRKHIAAGQSGGWICPDLPPAEAAGWLMCMAARGQHTLVAGADDAEVEALIEALTDIVWLGLYAYAPARQPKVSRSTTARDVRRINSRT